MARKGASGQIRIQWVSPNGSVVNGEPFSVPAKKTAIERRLNHARWDAQKTIRRFQWYLYHKDRKGVDAAVDASIRLDILNEALKSVADRPSPNQSIAAILLNLWNEKGLSSLPKALTADLALFTDAIRRFADPHGRSGLTLYRGENKSRHDLGIYGIAWTGRLRIARQFSSLRDSPGVVVKVRGNTRNDRRIYARAHRDTENQSEQRMRVRGRIPPRPTTACRQSIRGMTKRISVPHPPEPDQPS